MFERTVLMRVVPEPDQTVLPPPTLTVRTRLDRGERVIVTAQELRAAYYDEGLKLSGPLWSISSERMLHIHGFHENAGHPWFNWSYA